jgi:hypothetical protein
MASLYVAKILSFFGKHTGKKSAAGNTELMGTHDVLQQLFVVEPWSVGCASFVPAVLPNAPLKAQCLRGNNTAKLSSNACLRGSDKCSESAGTVGCFRMLSESSSHRFSNCTRGSNRLCSGQTTQDVSILIITGLCLCLRNRGAGRSMTITGLASSICHCPVGERKWQRRWWDARCSGTRSFTIARISLLLCLVLNTCFPKARIQHKWTSGRWRTKRSRANSHRRILESFAALLCFCVLGSNTNGGAGGGVPSAPELVPTGGPWSP